MKNIEPTKLYWNIFSVHYRVTEYKAVRHTDGEKLNDYYNAVQFHSDRNVF